MIKEQKMFIKNDEGKLKWNILPWKEMEDVINVLMNGSFKYGKDNWKKCDDTERYENALLRHVITYIEGDKKDSEDNKSHLAHAICNCLFLMYFDNQEATNDIQLSSTK